VAVHGPIMEYMPHYDQCAYARDVSIVRYVHHKYLEIKWNFQRVLLDVNKEVLTKKYKEIEATDV
jgi:glutathione peroxidase-family protein